MPIHEIKPLMLCYQIRGELPMANWSYPFKDKILILVDSGEPHGRVDKFAEYMKQCLAEWHETDQVELMGGNNEPKNSDVR